MPGCLRRAVIFLIDLIVIALLVVAAYLVYDHYYGIEDLPTFLQPLTTLSAPLSTSQALLLPTTQPPTPTPGLITGNASSYLPTLQELPQGFDLLSEGKPVVPIPESGTPSADQSEQYDSYQKEFLAADVSKI